MKVAIVGGGPSGLAAAKACLEEHLVPTVFERDMHLGGLWKLGSGGRVWKSLKSNLSKHTCCYSDFPWPRDSPTFPSADQVREYVESYAARFGLTRHVRFGHAVTSVSPTASGGWEIAFTTVTTTSKGCTDEDDVQHQQETFDRCIIASGIFSEPYFPPPTVVGGVTDAVRAGWATHGGAYREPAFCVGKTVLVVGCAFSGAEIASDLAGTATRCIVATGRPAFFLPRYIVKGGHQPSHAGGTEVVVQSRGRDGGAANAAVDCADVSEHVIGDVATGEAAERSIGTFTSYRGGNAVSRNGISNQADQGVDGSDAISAVKDTRAKGSGHLVPLDLALYSRKSKAGGTTSAVALSASEKIAKSREFLLELAGQDPGDAHEALSLDSCYERPSHVVVSDDFLDKVRASSIEVRPRLIALDAQERTAHFSDGVNEEIDHVIFCTGLRPCLEFLPARVLQKLEYDPNDSLQPLILQHQAWSPVVADLAFVGLYRGPYFGVIELQARWVARLWAGLVKPSTTPQSEAALRNSREIRAAHPRPQFPTDYVDIMEALADSAGLSLLPFGTADVGPVPTRFDSLSDKLEDRAKCVNLADIEQWQEEMRNLQGWMWNGPLLPCHYRLSEILSKHDISHAPAKSDERSTFLDVGYGGGGRLGDEREVLLRALAEIRDANTKLQSGVDLST